MERRAAEGRSQWKEEEEEEEEEEVRRDKE